MNRARLAALLSAAAVGIAVFSHSPTSAENKATTDPALQRTRRQVRMLDDLYKSAVVLITEKYVNTEDDLPAGTAFKALFSAMKNKGWHEVRLVDATGDPIMPGNAHPARMGPTPCMSFAEKNGSAERMSAIRA